MKKYSVIAFVFLFVLSASASTECDKVKDEIAQFKKDTAAFKGEVQNFKTLVTNFKNAAQDAQKKIDLYKKGALDLIAVSSKAAKGIGSCKKQFMVWAGCSSGARASIDTLNVVAVGR